MEIVTGKQMNAIDQRAINEYKIPSLKLMETAGSMAYEEIKDSYQLENTNVLILCGSGNNGGDGYVIARKMKEDFVDVEVFSTGDISKLSKDAKYNYNAAKQVDVNINDYHIEKIEKAIIKADIVIDAMLGTGLSRNVKDELDQIITLVNENTERSNTPVIAIDIPSGIGADNGTCYKNAIKADLTISFQLPKIGHILYPGAENTGKLIVKDIGIPQEAITQEKINMNILEKVYIKKHLDKKKPQLHKGTSGRLGMIAGSGGMAGACVLACLGAQRTGVGLIKAIIPKENMSIMQIAVPEVICSSQSENNEEQLAISKIDEIMEELDNYHTIVFGPGIGQVEENSIILEHLLKDASKTLVIDADGLNIIGEKKERLASSKGQIVITPHIGEMSRLTGLEKKHIIENKIKVAVEYAKENQVIVVLKNERTIIAHPDGEVYINTTGNPGMATAGSGDVLAGIIGSMIAQGIELKIAVNLAVSIHGSAGDYMAKQVGEYGLVAKDIAFGSALVIKESIE